MILGSCQGFISNRPNVRFTSKVGWRGPGAIQSPDMRLRRLEVPIRLTARINHHIGQTKLPRDYAILRALLSIDIHEPKHSNPNEKYPQATQEIEQQLYGQ